MFWTKKPRCKHDWHELETRTEQVFHDNGCDIDCEDQEFTYVYCPICDTNQRLFKEDWSLRKKVQEIKKQYGI